MRAIGIPTLSQQKSALNKRDHFQTGKHNISVGEILLRLQTAMCLST
jgi:hypothetical protein